MGDDSNRRPRVVGGGGFAGLSAVRELEGTDVDVLLLLDRDLYNTFQPLLYQHGRQGGPRRRRRAQRRRARAVGRDRLGHRGKGARPAGQATAAMMGMSSPEWSRYMADELAVPPDLQAPPEGRADIESGTHATGGIHGNPRDG